MKFMLNGALTLGTMDGANVEIVDEVGEENAFIFGLSSDEVINYENNGGYNPMDIFNSDMDIRKVLMQLINGFYSPDDPERFTTHYLTLRKQMLLTDTLFLKISSHMQQLRRELKKLTETKKAGLSQLC